MRKNDNIRCTVSECEHNLRSEDYCCLECVQISSHDVNPTIPECVDCNSFVKRDEVSAQ